ncbi:hypothetical protein R6Z07F_005532 [Ovis aries]
MVGWHHRLDGHEFEPAPGDGEGPGSLVTCGPGGRKELDMTERLNNSCSTAQNPASRQTTPSLSYAPAMKCKAVHTRLALGLLTLATGRAVQGPLPGCSLAQP